MELVFGTQVRSTERRLGYLAGIEVDPASSTVTRIIFSDDGKLGGHAHMRSFSAVRMDGSAIHVEDSSGPPPQGGVLMLNRSTRLLRGAREAARLTGAEVNDKGVLQALFGKSHWWTKRHRFAASALDFSAPGLVRLREVASAA